MRWLYKRQINVQNLLVTIDFSSSIGRKYFLNYLNYGNHLESDNHSFNFKNEIQKRLRFEDSENESDSENGERDFKPPRKRLTTFLLDEVEMGESDRVTPVRTVWRPSSAIRTLDLDLSADLNITIDYNSCTPLALKQASEAMVVDSTFKDAVSAEGISASCRQKDRCNRLKSICFRNCMGVTDDIVSAINPCRSLETLELLNCTLISDEGFVAMLEGHYHSNFHKYLLSIIGSLTHQTTIFQSTSFNFELIKIVYSQINYFLSILFRRRF